MWLIAATILIFTVANVPRAYSFMCLTYNLHTNVIEFSCEVHARHSVCFRNQNNEELGFCVAPFKEPNCTNNYKNVEIRQDLNSNRTLLTFRDKISTRMNGQWKCEHGTNLDEATVNITVFPDHGEERRCILCYSGVFACSFISVLTMINIITNYCAEIVKKIKHHSLQDKCPLLLSFLKREDEREAIKLTADCVMVVFFLIPTVIDLSMGCSTSYVVLVMIPYGFLCAFFKWAICFTREVYKDWKLEQERAQVGHESEQLTVQ